MSKKVCGNCFSKYKGKYCPNCGYTAERTKEGDELRVGTALCGRYTIGRVLGRGGFGITYLAYDEKSDRAVAIKEYYPGGAATRTDDCITVEPMTTYQSESFSDGMERFLKEANIITKFSESSTILGVYDVFRENGTAYYAMDFVKGVSLKEYVEKNGAISEGQAAYIAEKILPALNVLHKENVLHRDVCPDNIMLCANGKVRLVDFGAARILSSRSQSMSVIIKPGFAPLEQYSRKGKQDGRTDIYSLGASLYYALTLDTPEDPVARLDDDKPFIEKLKAVSEPLAGVIAKAAAVKPENRFEDAGKMLYDILGCGIETEIIEPIKTHDAQVPAADTAGLAKRRKRRVLFAAGAAALLAAVCAVVFVLNFQNFKDPSSVVIGDIEYSTEMTSLDLSHRGLTNSDIYDLKYMKNLTSLNLSDNLLTDLSCLSKLFELEDITFNNNNVKNIEFVNSLTKLRKISGENNLVTNIAPLEGKTELEEVFFGDCAGITDIMPIKDCRKLKKVGFNAQQVGSLEALRNLTELEMVCFQLCGLPDIEPLSECKKLKYVYIGRNNIEDMSPLKGCELFELYADNNNLSSHSDTFEGITVNGIIYLLDNGMSYPEIDRIKKIVDGDYEIYNV